MHCEWIKDSEPCNNEGTEEIDYLGCRPIFLCPAHALQQLQTFYESLKAKYQPKRARSQPREIKPMSETMTCSFCSNPPAVFIQILNLHVCQKCLDYIDERIRERNASEGISPIPPEPK